MLCLQLFFLAVAVEQVRPFLHFLVFFSWRIVSLYQPNRQLTLSGLPEKIGQSSSGSDSTPKSFIHLPKITINSKNRGPTCCCACSFLATGLRRM